MAALRFEVGCLAELATLDLSARYHRLRAIQADPLGTRSDALEVVGALRTSKQLQPDYAFPAEVPEDHAIRSAWNSVAGPPLTEKVRARRMGELAFDGTVGLMRPTDGATLFQRVDDEGRVLETAWLGGQDVPAVRNIEDLNGILGNRFLSRLRVFFDYRGGRMILEPYLRASKAAIEEP